MDLEDKTCVVRDAYIVSLCTFENGKPIEKHADFLRAIVISDVRQRFKENHSVLTSKIEKIEASVVYTRTGSQYIMLDEPIHVNCEAYEFVLLRAGIHPSDLTRFLYTDHCGRIINNALFKIIDDQLKIEFDKNLH